METFRSKSDIMVPTQCMKASILQPNTQRKRLSKTLAPALGDLAQWTECWLVDWRVLSSILAKATVPRLQI